MARTCRSVNPATPVLLVTHVPCEVPAHYQLITHILTHRMTEFINDLKPLIKAKHQIFDVHGSMHRNTNLTEITNKMRPCGRIYYSNVS